MNHRERLLTALAHEEPDRVPIDFAPTHDVQPDAPPQNVAAMYDAALEWGRYPQPG